MKPGLVAALTGIAVVVVLSKNKRTETLPAGRKRPRLAAAPTQDGNAPATGTAPQEGVNMKVASGSPARTNGGARVTAP